MIRSGEGRGGGRERRGTARPREGREGRRREGGRGGGPACARAPADSPASWPRLAPRPRRLQPRERALPPRRCTRNPALPRRAPAAPPAPRGRGPGSAAALGPGKPTLGARAGGSPLLPQGARRPREGGPGAHGRAFQLFFEGLACPLRWKMPTEAAAGVGKRLPPRFRHLRNSGPFARIWDAPAPDTLIKS